MTFSRSLRVVIISQISQFQENVLSFDFLGNALKQTVRNHFISWLKGALLLYFIVVFQEKMKSLFKVPLLNNHVSKKWSKQLIDIILKYRQRDESLNKRIQSHKLFICERHITVDQICLLKR